MDGRHSPQIMQGNRNAFHFVLLCSRGKHDLTSSCDLRCRFSRIKLPDATEGKSQWGRASQCIEDALQRMLEEVNSLMLHSGFPKALMALQAILLLPICGNKDFLYFLLMDNLVGHIDVAAQDSTSLSSKKSFTNAQPDVPFI